MKDGLYVTMQHYKICKHGKDVENITDCCLNYSPCVVRARDWTMTCKGAVNPVYGLFCAGEWHCLSLITYYYYY